MDKLIAELLDVLRGLLAAHERLLAIAGARQDAMRTFDVSALDQLVEREQQETTTLQELEERRRQVLARLQPVLGRNTPATISNIAARTGEPQRTVLLATGAALKAAAEKLARESRINATVSAAIISSMSKVLKVITGLAQHAGLYMRNGRKAAIHGIHLLDAVG